MLDIVADDKHDDKRVQALPVAALAPQRSPLADRRSVSVPSQTVRRKSIKKWAVLIVIAVVATVDIGIGVGVAVSRSRAATAEGQEAAAVPATSGIEATSETPLSSSTSSSTVEVRTQTHSSLPAALATKGASESAEQGSPTSARSPDVDTTSAHITTRIRSSSTRLSPHAAVARSTTLNSSLTRSRARGETASRAAGDTSGVRLHDAGSSTRRTRASSTLVSAGETATVRPRSDAPDAAASHGAV